VVKEQLKGFLEFAKEQGVIGLAIGLILGGAVGVLVKSLIDNVIMPPIGVILGSAEGLKGLSINMGTYNGKVAVLSYGIFLNDLINFVVIAAVVYFVVKVLGLTKDNKK
jgi:large conductance mechanosensitive channel